jgi:hypothetical protein
MKNIKVLSVALFLVLGLVFLVHAAERMVLCELSYSED